MDRATSELAGAIGARVREERLTRRWTLDQLAEAAGVSRRMLVTVEQGGANPSVGTLLRLGDALGVGLPALVEPAPRTTVTLTRRGEAPTLWTGAGGGHSELVAGTRSPDVVELWDWTLGAGDRHASEAHTAGTKELLHVLQGQLTVQIGAQTFALSTGDAIAFPGDVAHAYSHTSGDSTRFSLAVFEPGVGAHLVAATEHSHG